jgi:hypothetical protein
MVMKTSIVVLLLSITVCFQAKSQTFFGTAKDDAVIAFRNESMGQIRISPGSTSIAGGYYWVFGDSKDETRWLTQLEGSVKPNNQGIAAFIKSGKLQSGAGLAGAVGMRWAPSIAAPFFLLDVYVKPEWTLASNSMYDTTRVAQGNDALYKERKGYGGANLLVNAVWSPGRFNFFFGAQVGVLTSNNLEALDEVTIQTVRPFINQSNRYVVSDTQTARRGVYKDETTSPLKLDLIIDPGFDAGDASNTKPALFTYFRTDLKYNKNVNLFGLGVCFLKANDPSKVFASAGYELPKFGSAVDPEKKKADKGLFFLTVGYSIKK